MKDRGKTLEETKKISRRGFLGRAAATTAAFTIVPRHVLGGPGHTPPSEKLNVACIGVGGRGKADVRGVSSENIVAVCDVDEPRAAETFKNFPDAKKYRDFRRMLEKEDKNIDAVVVATPDHTHAVAAMMAIKMGKHVYCEKPLTHNIYEARQLTEAARKYKVVTQMGIQGHAAEELKLCVEMIMSGMIGNVHEVHLWSDRPSWPQGIDRPEETPPVPATLDWDLWLGPAQQRPYNPCYAPFSWRGWWDFGTGALGDMGCHIFDRAFWALKLGNPISVEAYSTKVNSETAPLASVITYEFAERDGMPPVKLIWYDGGLKPPKPEKMAAERQLPDNAGLFIGDKGIILAPQGGGPRLIPESEMNDFKRPDPILQREVGHHQDWIRGCKGGPKPLANFDYSGPLTEAVLLGNLAIRTGKKLDWDSAEMKVTNVPEANQYIRREYRQGWSL